MNLPWCCHNRKTPRKRGRGSIVNTTKTNWLICLAFLQRSSAMSGSWPSKKTDCLWFISLYFCVLQSHRNIFTRYFPRNRWKEIKTKTKYSLQMLRGSANFVCVDCGDTNPSWILSNYGVLLCDRCASIHQHWGTDLLSSLVFADIQFSSL